MRRATGVPTRRLGEREKAQHKDAKVCGTCFRAGFHSAGCPEIHDPTGLHRQSAGVQRAAAPPAAGNPEVKE